MSAHRRTVDLAAGEAALTDTAGAVETERDVVVVSGSDAEAFLQGQVSADVAALEDGASTWTLVLQPQGRIDVHARVTRRGGGFVVDTDGGWGDRLVERLSRFLLRMDCRLEPVTWRCVALRGPGSAAVAASAEIDAAVTWAGVGGRDLLGPDVEVGDVTWCPPEALEIVRILAGVARMGSEMDETTIPAAAGVVTDAVSFTKGCFVGQELVARIDSRGGQAPERLCGVIAVDELSPGDVLEAGGREVARVTSAGWSPRRGSWVGLAYLKRAVETPVDALFEASDGAEDAVATIVGLPFPD